MHEFENRTCHAVKERSKVSDIHQKDNPSFTNMLDRFTWMIEHLASQREVVETAP